MKKLINSFAVILVVCTFAFFAIASSSDAETSSNGTDDSGETNVATTQLPTYKIGESVTVKTSSGEYKVKITGVKETADRNEFADVEAKKVILVSYEYENISYQDDLFVSDLNMKVYDKENNLLESYPATEEKYGSSISLGRKGSAIDAFALNSDSNYAELEFYDNMFNSSPDCKFILEW